MNKIWRMLTAVLTALPLGGCWSKIELNDRSFITSAYIDMGDNPGEIMLTIGAPLPNRLGSASNVQSPSQLGLAYTSNTQSAATLPEALEAIQKDLTRKLTWGQTRAIVISEQFAVKRGMEELLEWASRNPSIPLRTFVFISEGQAKEIMNLTPVFERAPSEVLREFGNRHFVGQATLRDLAVASADGVGLAVPLLHKGKRPLVSEQGKDRWWVGPDGAAMIQDMHMKGTLDIEETKSVSWASGSLTEPIYQLLSGNGRYNIKLNELHGEVGPRFRNGMLECRVKLTAEATLESTQTTQDVTEPRLLHELERKINLEIATDMQHALDKSKQAGADVLQIGRRLEWRHPRYWDSVKNRWPETYREDMRFIVEANVRITHLNAENKPLWSTKKGGAS